jgi:hypothetical protein
MYTCLMSNMLRPTASNSTTVTVPAALSDIENELLDITKKFGPIVSHNYAVFQPFYEEILTNIPS